MQKRLLCAAIASDRSTRIAQTQHQRPCDASAVAKHEKKICVVHRVGSAATMPFYHCSGSESPAPWFSCCCLSACLPDCGCSNSRGPQASWRCRTWWSAATRCPEEESGGRESRQAIRGGKIRNRPLAAEVIFPSWPDEYTAGNRSAALQVLGRSAAMHTAMIQHTQHTYLLLAWWFRTQPYNGYPGRKI